MPPPVRRKTFLLVLALGAALAFAAVAYAGNGGFAPETPHSPNASRINDSYKWIAIFAALILIVVEGSLLWFVFRYRQRRRPRAAEGPQIHAHTRLELIFRRKLAQEGRLGPIRWLSMLLGVAGTYRKHENVDVAYEVEGRRTVATLVPTDS